MDKFSKAAKHFVGNLKKEYAIHDSYGQNICNTLEGAKEMELRADSTIKTEGLQVTDRFGQLKPHPLLPALRDARSQVLAALKMLNIDMIPLQDKPGRPAGR